VRLLGALPGVPLDVDARALLGVPLDVVVPALLGVPLDTVPVLDVVRPVVTAVGRLLAVVKTVLFGDMNLADRSSSSSSLLRRSITVI
jgi:hypothetical protein